MRNQQQRTRKMLQPRLQPNNCVQIQMIRRLIQKQEIRTAHKRSRQIQPHPPAARKIIDRVFYLIFRKAQTVQ